MKRLCIILAFLMIFTSGCLLKQTQKESVKLYFAVKGNIGLGTENKDIEYRCSGKYENTLKELLKGPSDTEKYEKV